ncbi:MAG: transglutaminase-like domain-containing protein, partial [Armatimonadota bacterium]|nr:transglutaminase-like domain-containing protein [Armatimonadota bacterium]
GDAGGPLRTHITGPYGYDVTLSPDDQRQGPFCSPLTSEERERCLAVPRETDPKVRAVAQTIARGQSGQTGRAAAVVQYLLSNYGYSQTFNAGAGDPISNFILGKKPAHCQYFASAAVVLLRCLGVPARYVQGYYAHESGGAGVTIVRQRDAHAWAEAWMDGLGWVTLDATPGGGRPDHTASALPFWQKGWD